MTAIRRLAAALAAVTCLALPAPASDAAPTGLWSCHAAVDASAAAPAYAVSFILRVVDGGGFVAEGASRAGEAVLRFRAAGRWAEAAGALRLDGVSRAEGRSAPFRLTADIGRTVTLAAASADPHPGFAQRADCRR